MYPLRRWRSRDPNPSDKTVLTLTTMSPPSGAKRQRKIQYFRRHPLGDGEQSTASAPGRQDGVRHLRRHRQAEAAGLWQRSLVLDSTASLRPGGERRSWSPGGITFRGERILNTTAMPSGLRDVNEPFMDTGLGREGLPIIDRVRLMRSCPSRAGPPGGFL